MIFFIIEKFFYSKIFRIVFDNMTTVAILFFKFACVHAGSSNAVFYSNRLEKIFAQNFIFKV